MKTDKNPSAGTGGGTPAIKQVLDLTDLNQADNVRDYLEV